MFLSPAQAPEIVVQLPQNESSRPKAVVVLLGWFGSKIRHVRKYSELYEQRGCATITASLDDRSVILVDIDKIKEFVVLITKEAAKLLRVHDEVPLVFHVFSNGGAIPLQVLERMMVRMSETPQKNTGCDDGRDGRVEDWVLIRERFGRGAEVFDSAPAYPDMTTFRRAMAAALPNAILAYFLFLVVSVGFYVKNLLTLIRGERPFVERYWAHWMERDPCSSTQVYVYSTADTITRYEKIEEIQAAQKLKGAQIIVKRFSDSGHVQHLRVHKTEYCALIDQILASC